MTPSRIAAIIAIVLGVFALAFVGLRGSDAPRYNLIFDDAGGLIPGNLIRVNGLQTGTVTDIGITDDLKANVEIEITELGPLRQGTTAQIRAASLGGVANKYIALQLAPNNAPELKDGTIIGQDDTRGIVGQDEFINSLDEPTRKGIQQFVKGSAQIVEGNSENLQKALDNAPGTLREAREFASALNAGDDALRKIIVNGAAVSSALAERTESITRLSRNAGIAGEAAAGNGTEIGETLARSPQALDEATAILNELPGTLDDVQALIEAGDQVRGGVPERLNQLTDTLTSGEDTIGAVARALNKPGANNDAADLLAASVDVGKNAEKAAKTVPGALSASTPLIAKTRAYTPDVTAAITGLGLVSANYDGAGHYLRLSSVLNVFQASGSGASTDLISRDSFVNRLQGYQVTTNRCPGSAAQATSDGSAPFTDGGRIACSTSDVPPGP
ncbi:MAG: MCE family protein [Solirubrobacteraceae bacterium]|nr:MCE family protein [Solirubrobacteraceae bacterium]